MMRIMLDECGYGWDAAWNIVTRTIAYTNHTVMAEALECWGVELFKKLVFIKLLKKLTVVSVLKCMKSRWLSSRTYGSAQ